MAHAFNATTQEAETGDLCEVKASLGYRVSFRTGSIATKKPCLGKPITKPKQNKTKIY